MSILNSPPAFFYSSSWTRANPTSKVFTKTSHDTDRGELEIVSYKFAESRKASSGEIVNMLAVGTGLRTSDSGSSEQTILAHSRTGTDSMDRTNFYWRSGGSDPRTSYATVSSWFPGLWVAQVTSDSAKAQQLRGSRIFSILSGAESIKYAMITKVDPKAYYARLKIQRQRRAEDDKSETITTPLKRKAEPIGRPSSPPTARRQTKNSMDAQEPPGYRTPPHQPSIHRRSLEKAIQKTRFDIDGSPVFARTKQHRDKTYSRMLLVGKGAGTPQDRYAGPEIYALPFVGPSGYRTTRFFSGTPGKEVSVLYNSIQYWLKGFWKEQVTNNVTTELGARSARLFNIFEKHETLEHAMATRFDPADAPGIQVAAKGTSNGLLDDSDDDSDSDSTSSLSELFDSGSDDIPLSQSKRLKRHAQYTSPSELSDQDVIEVDEADIAKMNAIKRRDISPATSHIVCRHPPPAKKASRRSKATENAASRPAVADASMSASHFKPAVANMSMPAAKPTPVVSSSAVSTQSTLVASLPKPTVDENCAAEMTVTDALAIFYGDMNGRNKPVEVQNAVRVLTGSTPPLTVIQLAVFECRHSKDKNKSIDDATAYQEWMKENKIET